MIDEPLQDGFFEDEPLVVARRLLGQRLVRRIDGELLAGRIVEVEAYGGREDSTSHAARGAGVAAMRGPVGRAYIYLIYGMYFCLNVVAHPLEATGAVLIRALSPERGVEAMRARRRGGQDHLLASGPGRLCMALAIDRTLEGIDMCDAQGPLFIAAGLPVADEEVMAGPRIGVVGRAEDVALPWRLHIAGDPHVSPGRGPTRTARHGRNRQDAKNAKKE